MKNRFFVVMVFTLCFAAGTWGHAQEIAGKPKGESQVLSGIAMDAADSEETVESIDAAARSVTLKNEKGEVRTVKCGPEVKNFDQIRVGDKVSVSVTQLAEVTLLKDADAPLTRTEQVDIAGAPLGEKPKGTLTATLKVMAVVDEIDYATRRVTLQGPERKVTLKIDPDEAKNFDRMEKGDNVYLELTEIEQIEVTGQ